MGSSPRRRGKHGLVPSGGPDHGLIPAWAGKTRFKHVDHDGTGAHPRVGGENLFLIRTSCACVGSSPRGRGKLGPRKYPLKLQGLIPAWAGKTGRPASSPRGRAAHPRVGGENSYGATIAACFMGSSPRGRGKRIRRDPEIRGHGLIPAWAGKTAFNAVLICFHRAHPRVGGENSDMD